MKSWPWPYNSIVPAVTIWGVATAAIIPGAPFLGSLPLLVITPIVAIVCLVLGALYVRLFARRENTDERAKIGSSIAIIGLALDAILVLSFDGQYPNAAPGQGNHILLLLLAGYAAFALGAALPNRATAPTRTAQEPSTRSASRLKAPEPQDS